MSRLDTDEACARQPSADAMSAGEVVDYLRDLPRVWAEAPTSRSRIAEALFERIEVLGFQRARVHPSGAAIGRGLVAALPVSCSLPVYGRGERASTDTPSPSLIIPVTNVPSYVYRTSKTA
jgi:hypothetical protein